MDIFEGTPKEKFFDILYNSNRNLVENELENFFIKFIAFEEICRQKGIHDGDVVSFLATNQDIIEEGLNDIYISLTGNILSNHE